MRPYSILSFLLESRYSPPHLEISYGGEPSRVGARGTSFCTLRSRRKFRLFLFRCPRCFPCLCSYPRRKPCRCCLYPSLPTQTCHVLPFGLSTPFRHS